MKTKKFFYISITVSIAIFAAFFLFPGGNYYGKISNSLATNIEKTESANPASDATSPASRKITESTTNNPLRVKTNRPAPSEILPFESELLWKNTLDSKKIQSLLFSKRFDAQVDLFTNQSATDPNASELSSLYKKILDTQLEKNRVKVQIRRLVCGTSICIGSMENGDDSEYSRWSDIFFNDPATSSYGFVNSTIHLGADRFEHRFVFSTDPAANSITIIRK